MNTNDEEGVKPDDHVRSDAADQVPLKGIHPSPKEAEKIHYDGQDKGEMKVDHGERYIRNEDGHGDFMSSLEEDLQRALHGSSINDLLHRNEQAVAHN